ncbi:MAG: DNA-packaging protein [Clostridiales bacterium GWF2_38_85]|nr:MAG: DNA-packaging protein [Clostridiales bacterium GWF2_38_85]
MIYAIRQYLRINHTHFDIEITDLVEAARADLILGGILLSKVNDESDSLVKRAIVCYVKAGFGLDNADAEKYAASYDSLKRHLMLSSEYTTEG